MNVYFRLYDYTGLTPIYTFPIVFSANYPHTEKQLIEHTSLRGKGSIIVEGGDSAWDITLKGVLKANDYEALTVLIDAMETAVVLNTAYVLKINKTVSTYYEYKVKRISPIIFDEANIRTSFIEYQVTFRVNSW
jgi:hypothetical protein